MKRTIIIVGVVVSVLGGSEALAVDGNKAMYVGGTLTGVKEKAEGPFNTKSETAIQFSTKKDGSIDIPYANITGLEYGQKAGRRVAVAVLVSPLALFSKKRNHFLTVSFTDPAGKDQSAVFELGKDIVRTTLAEFERGVPTSPDTSAGQQTGATAP